MGFNLFFWNNSKLEINQSKVDDPLEIKNCFCGRNKNYSDCHELEFALPLGMRPEPD